VVKGQEIGRAGGVGVGVQSIGSWKLHM